jgi:hypothetical protein
MSLQEILERIVDDMTDLQTRCTDEDHDAEAEALTEIIETLQNIAFDEGDLEGELNGKTS